MDALSDLMHVVRFSGGVFLDACFRGPWCVRSQVVPQDLGPGIQDAGGLVAFHYVLDGSVEVRVEGQGGGPRAPAKSSSSATTNPTFSGVM